MTRDSADSGHQSRRVLVIFPGALGDLICFLPALRALSRRHRDASIELMAREELAHFSVRRMGVQRAHSIDRREVSLLFSEAGDPGSETRRFFGLFHRVYSFFAGDDRGFRQSLAAASGAEVSFHPFRPDGDGHAASACLRSLGEAGEPIEARLDPAPADLEAARRRLDALALAPGDFALLIPGSGSVAKNWPARRFVELAELMRGRLPVAFVLGPAETALQGSFAARGFPTLANLALHELAAVAALCSVFVGNDSGPSHLAAAAGAPGVALFGPTDPRRWRPLGRVRVMRRLPLEDLSAEEVAAPALEILAASRTAA